jgi:hypothetical protein
VFFNFWRWLLKCIVMDLSILKNSTFHNKKWVIDTQILVFGKAFDFMNSKLHTMFQYEEFYAFILWVSTSILKLTFNAQIREQINLDVENNMKNTMHIQDLWTMTKCGCIVQRHVTCLRIDHNIHIIWSVQTFPPDDQSYAFSYIFYKIIL